MGTPQADEIGPPQLFMKMKQSKSIINEMKHDEQNLNNWMDRMHNIRYAEGCECENCYQFDLAVKCGIRKEIKLTICTEAKLILNIVCNEEENINEIIQMWPRLGELPKDDEQSAGIFVSDQIFINECLELKKICSELKVRMTILISMHSSV